MKKLPFAWILFALPLLLQGCEKSKEQEEPNNPPLVNISASPGSGIVPLEVEFDASGSTDPDGDALTYSWNLGDGSSSTMVKFTKTYTKTGTYHVTATVTDEHGLSDDGSLTIEVKEPPPPLFPLSGNAQWVYRVTATSTENGVVSEYEQGITYLVVSDIRKDFFDYINLRVTGKRYYNGSALTGEYIYLSHYAGSGLRVRHSEDESYNYMIDLSKSSWSNYSMFFSANSSQSVTLSTSNVTIGLGTYLAYRVRHHTDNWGQSYVTERYDLTEEEFLDPEVGLVYRETSRLVDMLDCFYCPVYGGSSSVELIGYYIPQEDGAPLTDGTGYNPDNPYGGDLGLKTVWAEVDIGYTYVYLDGESVGYINNYWSGGVDCDTKGALNVFRPAGNYTLTAESSLGYKWEGTITFTEAACTKVKLNVLKKSAGGDICFGITDE
jgi:PKD repeat protein